MLAKRLHCASQLFAGRLPARSASKDATDALGRISENCLKPILESRIGDLIGFLLRGDFEERIDSRLDRPLMEEISAKGVDRADTSELQLLERSVEPTAFLSRRFRPCFFDLAAQTKLHFAGRLFGEGDRDDAIERSCASADQADDPTNEGCGFSGPSRRLDKKGRAKLLSDSTSCFGIRKIGHGSARKARSGSRFPCGFRAARRSS